MVWVQIIVEPVIYWKNNILSSGEIFSETLLMQFLHIFAWAAKKCAGGINEKQK